MASYTPKDKQRALTALYASGEDVDGEWVPNFNAVSRMARMPTYKTLASWWEQRDRRDDSKNLQAAQRAREQARQQGGQDFFEQTGEALKEGLSWVLSREHRQKVPRVTMDGKPIVDPETGEAAMVYLNRPDHMSRAYKDAAQTAEKMRDLWGIGKAPEQQAPSSPSEARAALVKTLLSAPELMEQALRADPSLLPLLLDRLKQPAAPAEETEE